MFVVVLSSCFDLAGRIPTALLNDCLFERGFNLEALVFHR